MAKIKWLLLADTRRQCWRAWWLGASPLLLFLLVQTISTRFEGMELIAWLWALIVIFPGFTVLFVSTARARLPQKLISSGIHTALVGATWGYVLLLYLTVVAEVHVLNTGGALKDYLLLSYAWLIPALALVLAGYYLVFYSRARLARPDNRNILELAAQKARNDRYSAAARDCFARIAGGDLAGAFQWANDQAGRLSEPARIELTVLSGNFSRLRAELESETASAGAVQQQINRLTIGLMNLAERL